MTSCRAVRAFVLFVMLGAALAPDIVNAVPPGARLLDRFELPGESPFYVGDLCWEGPAHLLLADARGVERLDLRSGNRSVVVPAAPLPDGAYQPFGVDCRDGMVLVFSLSQQYLAAWELPAAKLSFALRKPPGFMIKDIALWGSGRMALLGYPRDKSGRMADPDGVAVWAGPLTPTWKDLWPVHALRGGPAAAAAFEFSLWPLGGHLAVEADGTLDVVSPVEPGIYRYDRQGRLRGVLGADLDRLVGRDLRRAFEAFGDDSRARYREFVNRQPWIDALVATADGPALVVRRVAGDTVRWEVWWPGKRGVSRRVSLPLSARDLTAQLHCSARGETLACCGRCSTEAGGSDVLQVVVVSLPATGREGGRR